MSSTIRLLCPNLKCRAVLSVPIIARGKTVRCRQCGMRVQIPAVPLEPKPSATTSPDQTSADQPAPADAPKTA
jgi:hypothetical protein